MPLTAFYRLPGRPTRPATGRCGRRAQADACGGRQKTEAKTASRVGVIHHPSPVPAQARRHTPPLPPASTATSVSPRLTSRRRRPRVRPGKANSRARATARSRSADVQVRPGRRAGAGSGRRRWRQRAARAGRRRRRGEVDGGAVEDGGHDGAGAAAAPGARVALLPPRPRRHGVQPARRQPRLPPVPRVQLLPGHLDRGVAVRHGAGPARRPPARLRAGPDRDEEGVGPRRLRRRPGRRLLLDIGHVRGGAGDGLHAPESGQPVHRLGGGSRQHGVLRLPGHRPLCSRLRTMSLMNWHLSAWQRTP
ncbi:hypothetical protein PVAP13_9KG393890 [Panicum virgatum]|uniref:Uncharacterized protein n=1 Tax=Panicum virgatum TaxID=38727 RepID=A0A8T0N9T7_PANVG|nr:hypothetical protein PVAP13_9KG393890 [Panicum virgatum]